jgi:methionine-rich copper-binding protein CopC
MTEQHRTRALALLVAVWLLAVAVPTWAHTDFDYSTPSSGETVAEPVTEVVVAFTLPVTIVGDGFQVLDPQGTVLSPTVETADNTVFTLLIDSPLVDGEAGVRYEVAAEDGHVLAGGFSFEVTASATTTTVVTTTTTAPPTTTTASSTTTIAATTTTATQATTTTSPDATGPDGDPDDGSSSGLLVALGAAVVMGGGALAWRLRRNGGP